MKRTKLKTRYGMILGLILYILAFPLHSVLHHHDHDHDLPRISKYECPLCEEAQKPHLASNPDPCQAPKGVFVSAPHLLPDYSCPCLSQVAFLHSPPRAPPIRFAFHNI